MAEIVLPAATRSMTGTTRAISSSASSGVAPAAPAAASRSINVNFDLFETLLDGYCAIDEDGLVLYVNAALERMFGYSRRKVIGHVSKEKEKKEEVLVHFTQIRGELSEQLEREKKRNQ